MSADQDSRARQRRFENTIIDYVTKDNGHFITLTDDHAFLSLFRMMLIKDLSIMQNDILTAVSEPSKLLEELKKVQKNHPNPLLFMERVMGGKDISFLVRQFKENSPNIRIIVLTSSPERERIMLLHEIGADNFIAKPASGNTVIEKMATTLRPQTRLSQLLDKVQVLLDNGQGHQALHLCQQILDSKPNNAPTYLVLGDILYNLKRIEEAKEAYENAVQKADLFMEPLHRLARLCADLGDTQGQLAYLKRLDNLSPLNVERKVDMGGLHVELGDLEEAEKLFDAAVDQIKKDAMDNISSVAERIATIFSDKDPVRAEKFLREGLEAKAGYLSRDDINTFNQLGISLRQQGRWQDAITEYTKALKIAPDDENLYYNMAMACAEGKDFLSAKTNMERALHFNPDLYANSAKIAYNFGYIFLQAGDQQGARRFLQHAIELDPGFEPAKLALRQILP